MLNKGKTVLNQEEAELVAIQALQFLASDDERLEPFLAKSGLQHDTLREAAATPGFFGAVLDYMLSDEKLLMTFAQDLSTHPESIVSAAHRLSGVHTFD